MDQNIEAKPLERSRWPLLGFLAVTAAGLAIAFWPPSFKPWQMRLLHIAVFPPWTLTLSATWRRTLHWLPSLARELTVAVLAAITAEVLQTWLPPHIAEWQGLSASLAGVALAGTILWRSQKRRDAKQA